MTAKQILDREFLEMRCRLIDLAASFDRIQRGANSEAIESDPRMRLLLSAPSVLTDGQSDRAARLEMHFSDDYQANWQEALGLAK